MDFSDDDGDYGSDTSVTFDDLQEDFNKASLQFTIKIARAKRLLPALRISVKMFLLLYHTISPAMPSDLDLSFYLVNCDTIASGNFLAHPAKGKNVCRAIWYYNSDNNHYFSH